MPLTTFGTATHLPRQILEATGRDPATFPGVVDSVAVLGLPDGVLIDPDIAELTALLNRAGIETVQSCQDIGDEDDREVDPDLPRIGIIVVAWETFPALAAMLRPALAELGPFSAPEHNTNGWLYVAHGDAKYVSILFPFRDLDVFTSAAS